MIALVIAVPVTVALAVLLLSAASPADLMTTDAETTAVEQSGLPTCDDVLSGEAPLPESGECIETD